MPRGGQKSYMQQMFDDNRKKAGGDMNKPAKGHINPYQKKATNSVNEPEKKKRA